MNTSTNTTATATVATLTNALNHAEKDPAVPKLTAALRASIEREQLIADLREWMPSGTTVYTIIRSVSRSGMSRIISPVVFTTSNRCVDCGGTEHSNIHQWETPNYHKFVGLTSVEPIFPEYKIAKLLDWRLHKNQGIVVNGCGMDMGFHLVNSLSYALCGDGYALKQRWL